MTNSSLYYLAVAFTSFVIMSGVIYLLVDGITRPFAKGINKAIDRL